MEPCCLTHAVGIRTNSCEPTGQAQTVTEAVRNPSATNLHMSPASPAVDLPVPSKQLWHRGAMLSDTWTEGAPNRSEKRTNSREPAEQAQTVTEAVRNPSATNLHMSPASPAVDLPVPSKQLWHRGAMLPDTWTEAEVNRSEFEQSRESPQGKHKLSRRR